ncbi:hypothetical protein ACNQFZ_09780 [Schinkia sp. CFF1]
MTSMKQLFQKVLILFFVSLLILFPVLPTVFLAEGWTGNTWEGKTWEGKTWDEKPWTGNTWEGKTWSGNSEQVNSPSGKENSTNGPHSDQVDSLNPSSTNSNDNNQNASNSESSKNPSSSKKEEEKDLKDYIDFAIKDIGFGTIKLVDELANENNVDITLTKVNDFKGSILRKGFKTIVDDPGLNAPVEAYDTIKETWDAYQNLYDIKNTMRGAEIAGRTLPSGALGATSASNVLAATSKTSGVLSALGLGYASYETYDNIKKAVNSTGEKRTDAIVDSVGSVGDMLMSGGGIAAAIPVGQAAAVGLIGVGAALKLGSSAVKLYRRRDEIAESWGKKWKKVKGWFGK